MGSPAVLMRRIQANVEKVILGKPDAIALTVLGMVTGGHLLMEDVPGVGKTVLSKTLARSLSAQFKRIQFTPDLLPADVTGTSVFDPRERTFDFKKGPVFANVVLADEINRASPRTQSALLEAMSEGQVSADGITWKLPDPFLVIATQNPIDFHGTYPLPEAQMDRFSIKLELGYPAADAETDVLLAQAKEHPYESLSAVASIEEMIEARAQVRALPVSRPVARYMVDLARHLREHPSVRIGVSPRGTLALFRTAQGMAALRERDHVAPEDVKAVALPVLAHRLVLQPKAKYAGVNPRDLVAETVATVALPS